MPFLRFAAAVGALLTIATASRVSRAELSVEACADAYSKGQEERLVGRLFSARAQFALCGDPSCPNAVVQDCKRWISEVEAELPTLLVKAVSASGDPIENLHVWLDGASIAGEALALPLVVDVGPHVLRFEAPSYEPLEIQTSLRPEDRAFAIKAVMHPLLRPITDHDPLQDHSLESPTSAPRREPFPTAAVALAGVGTVALGGSLFFYLTAKHDFDDLKTSCAPYCAQSEADKVRSKELIADAALAASVLAFGGAAWLYFGRQSEASTSTALSIDPRADGARLRLAVPF